MVGQFGAGETIFHLEIEDLNALNLGHGESVTIARAENAIGSDFNAWLGVGTTSLDAAVYRYDISVSGTDVQVSMDYANWGMRVWYQNAWVGMEDWDEYLVAGYEAVNGVETVDLGGETVDGVTLLIAPGAANATTVLSHGEMVVEMAEVVDGQLQIAADATLDTTEMAAEGKEIHLLGELKLSEGRIGTLSGTTGKLSIASGGEVSIDSSVTLGTLTNSGTLDIGKNKLNVAAAVTTGGNVIAGEVVAHNRANKAAVFNALVADKVTVTNSLSSNSYKDAISLGDGSVIGELMAETLEVREGTVTLGRTSGSTEMSLLSLDLQNDATLVLNQQTTLEVTDTLTATENATVQLKQNAAVSYDGMNISNRKESALSVNAYALSGETDLELNGAHVAATGSEDKVIDYKLVNSTVENAGTGTLRVTHAENSLSGVVASSGNVEVYNVTGSMSLDELRIATGLSVSLLTGDAGTPIEPAQEADVTVVGLAVFEKGATLNANLTMAAGSELRMEGPLHMGSTLELVSGADSITLGGSMYDAVAGMQLGEIMTLFTGVDALVLSFDGVSVTYQPGDIQVGDRVLASDFFGNLPDPGANREYFITFTTAEVGGGELAFFMAPEPTTTTLSLLALTALAARRRRK